MVGADDELYYPHAGEPVQMVPVRTFAEIKEYQRFGALTTKLAALREQMPPEDADPDDPEVQAQWDRYRESREAMRDEQQQSFDELCRFLAARVLRITWTNLLGQPSIPWTEGEFYTDPETGAQLPCARIDGDASKIAQLDSAELHYLLTLQRGETPKNDSSGSSSSETTSSGSTPAATAAKPSTSGHNPTKAS